MHYTKLRVLTGKLVPTGPLLLVPLLLLPLLVQNHSSMNLVHNLVGIQIVKVLEDAECLLHLLQFQLETSLPQVCQLWHCFVVSLERFQQVVEHFVICVRVLAVFPLFTNSLFNLGKSLETNRRTTHGAARSLVRLALDQPFACALEAQRVAATKLKTRARLVTDWALHVCFLDLIRILGFLSAHFLQVELIQINKYKRYCYTKKL